MRVAIIPARSGSKRIPGKNVKIFLGRPIIGVTIDVLLRSGVFDKIFVSTDSEEIATIAMAAGAEVPFLRPELLANDHASTIAVMKHAVENLVASGMSAKYCCVYPTAPFVRSEDIMRAYDLLVSRSADYVFPVAEYLHPIQRALELSDDWQIDMVGKEYELSRSQDLCRKYHDVGQFYWGAEGAWLEGRGIFTSRSIGLPVSSYLYRDINTIDDWKSAEEFWHFLEWKKREVVLP